MNLLALFQRPDPQLLPHVVVKYVAATANDNAAAAAKRREVRDRLEALVAPLTPEQRRAARERAALSSLAQMQGRGRG